jgi:Family of unknown function (DUF6159)
MFASIRRGFGFLGQAASMAAKDMDLLKPSFYALIAGGIITLLSAVPFLGILILLGNQDIGKILLFICGAVMIFLQYAVTYVFAGMTVKLVNDYLTEGDGRMDKAWATVRRDFFDILTLAAVSAVMRIIENLARGRRGRRNLLGEVLAGILNAVWTVATYFVLPAMILEDLNLGQALKRATQIIKNNLMLVAVTEVGVGGVVGFLGFLLVLAAIALGGGVLYLVGSLANWSAAGILIGGGAAVLLAGIIIAVVTALSSYVTTAYHTCLFIWAREVEQARAQGLTDASVTAPAPLAAVI